VAMILFKPVTFRLQSEKGITFLFLMTATLIHVTTYMVLLKTYYPSMLFFN
jgi:hypothetical protein